MRRGDIYLANLDPTTGAEADKIRPVVIVSNDKANAAASYGRGVVTVIPLTSNLTRVYPFQVRVPAVPGLAAESKAQAEQVRAVAVQRLGGRLGVVPSDTLAAIDRALRLHLSL